MTPESDRAFEDKPSKEYNEWLLRSGHRTGVDILPYQLWNIAFQAGRASKLDWPELKEFQKEHSHKKEYSAHANFWVVEFYAWLKERMK